MMMMIAHLKQRKKKKKEEEEKKKKHPFELGLAPLNLRNYPQNDELRLDNIHAIRLCVHVDSCEL